LFRHLRLSLYASDFAKICKFTWSDLESFLALGRRDRAYAASQSRIASAAASFRHTYRTLIDDIDTPLGVQQRLMRHADIKTTMNTYGSAFEKTKRRANSRVADLVLPPAIKSQLKGSAKEVSLKNLRPETATIQ